MKKSFVVAKTAVIVNVFLFFTLLFTTCGGGAAGGTGGASISADEYTTHNPSGWGGGGGAGGNGGPGVNMTGGTPLVVERYEDPVTGTFAGSQLNDLIAAIQNNSSRSNSVFYVPFYVVGDPVVRQARVTKGNTKVEKFEHQYKATCSIPPSSAVSVFYYYVEEGINLASITTAEMTGWQCQEDGSVHSGSHITNITGDVSLVPVYASGAGPINGGVIRTDLHTGAVPAVGETFDYQTLAATTVSGSVVYITIPPITAGTVLYQENGTDVSCTAYSVHFNINGTTFAVTFAPGDTQAKVIENIPLGANISTQATIEVSGGTGYTVLNTETVSLTAQAGGNITLYTKYPYTCGIANAFSSQASINGSTTGYYSNNGNPTTINVTPSASYTSGGQTWYFAGWATSSTATNPDIVGNIIPANTYQGALNLYAVYSSCSVSIASSDSTGTNVIAENSMLSSLTLNAEPAGDFQTTPTYSWNIESPSSNPPVSLSSVSGPSITVTPFTGRTGTATIKVTASDGTHTASSTINVTVAGLSLGTTGPIVLAKGGTANIQAEVIGGYSGGIDYSWNPPSNTLFSYSAISGSSNTITANAGGKTTITVGAEITDNGLNLMLSKTIDVYVLDLQLTGSGLTQAGTDYGLMTTMYNTAGTTVSASLTGTGMPTTTFSWALGTADNSSTYLDLLGSANDSRTIKPKADGAGTVTVSTSYGGVTVSKTINVVVLGLSLNTTGPIYIEKDNNFDITASVANYGSGDVTYNWTVSDSSVVTLSGENTVTNTSVSNKTVYATAGGKSTIIVTATITAGNIQLPPKTIDVYVLDLQLESGSFLPGTNNIAMTSSATDFSTVTASLAGTGMPSTTYTWTLGTADNSSTVLELDGTTGTTCTITPKAAGTGTVTVSATCGGGVTVSKTINVSVAGISLPASPIVLTKGGSTQTITPALIGYSGPISWTWNPPDSSIATFSDSGNTGTIAPVAGGKTTLTVSTNVNGRPLSQTIDIYVLDLVLSGGTDDGLIGPTGGNYTLIMPAGSSNVPLTAHLANISDSEVTFDWDPISNATVNGTGGSRTITPSSVGQSTFNIRAKITGTSQIVTATVALKVVSLTISGPDSFAYNETKEYTVCTQDGITLSNINFSELTDPGSIAGISQNGDTGTVTATKGGTYTIQASATVMGTSITLTATKTISIINIVLKDATNSSLALTDNMLSTGSSMTLKACLEGIGVSGATFSWTANSGSHTGEVSFNPSSLLQVSSGTNSGTGTNATNNVTITGRTPGTTNVTVTVTYDSNSYTKTLEFRSPVVTMKTGTEINTILTGYLSAGSGGSARSFAASASAPADGTTTYKFSTNNSEVECLAWLDGTAIKYYAAGYTNVGVKIPLNADSSNMFSLCHVLTSIDMSGFDTSNVTNMGHMFQYCSSLESLNLSSFNTGNVGNMISMFESCESLESLNLNNFDTSNVNNMSLMFEGCESLESLTLSNFNTGNVADMSYMFRDCSSLESLDLSNFNTGNVVTMSYMFRDCSILTTIYASAAFDTTNVIHSEEMFYGCTSLKGGGSPQTAYSSSHADKEYARIDGGSTSATPGYFTAAP